jgi:hypothetical protein
MVPDSECERGLLSIYSTFVLYGEEDSSHSWLAGVIR